jgi:group I intron endonuclease
MHEETRNQIDRIIYLYRVTCTINQKVYIGQTVDSNSRWRGHRRDAANPKVPFHFAIRKHGAHNFEFEIIACCKGQDNANDLETLLVAQYDSYVSHGKGYNASHGGMNAPKSEEWKKKASEAKLGDKNPMFGKPTWNTGKSVFIGEDNPFYGKHHTAETNRKNSEWHKGKPAPFAIKWSSEDKETIKQLYLSGLTSRQIGKQFKRSPTTIVSLLRKMDVPIRIK